MGTRGDKFPVIYVDGDVPQLPIQLGQLLVDTSLVSPGTTNLQQCTSQDPVVYEPIGGGGGSGTVTSIAAGTGIEATPDPITTTGTIALDAASQASLALAASALQPSDLSSIENADLVTFSDESATFPNSRTLTEGTGIDIALSPAGAVTISAVGVETIAATQVSDLVITSDNVFQTTQLTTSLVAGTYAFTFKIWTSVHATPDMEVQLQYTGTVTHLNGLRNAARITLPTTTQVAITGLPATYNMNDTSRFYVEFKGNIEVSDAGTFAMYARQVTSSGTSVTFLAGSHMTLLQLL